MKVAVFLLAMGTVGLVVAALVWLMLHGIGELR